MSVFGLFLLCQPVFAENVSKLNKKNVEDFVTNASRYTSGNDRNLSHDKLNHYLDKHLSKDARFVTTVTYHIPKASPQTHTIALDKDKLIEMVGKGAGSIEGYHNQITVNEIDLSFWGKKAFVKTKNVETGFMAVPNPEGETGETVPIEGVSNCAQVIILNDGVIQLENAVCETSLTFKK